MVRHRFIFCLSTLVATTGVSLGCRAHPGSLAMMLVGDLVNDADVKQRSEALMGRNITAADSLFGDRLETLEDSRHRGRWMVVYPVKGDLLGSSRYVVEANFGEIRAISKTIQNIDGAEDVIHGLDLRSKLKDQRPAACRAELGRPVLVMRNLVNGTLVRVYDVRNITNLRGGRYCVLRFDSGDRCRKINLVGVSASTKSDPARP